MTAAQELEICVLLSFDREDIKLTYLLKIQMKTHNSLLYLAEILSKNKGYFRLEAQHLLLQALFGGSGMA